MPKKWGLKEFFQCSIPIYLTEITGVFQPKYSPPGLQSRPRERGWTARNRILLNHSVFISKTWKKGPKLAFLTFFEHVNTCFRFYGIFAHIYKRTAFLVKVKRNYDGFKDYLMKFEHFGRNIHATWATVFLVLIFYQFWSVLYQNFQKNIVYNLVVLFLKVKTKMSLFFDLEAKGSQNQLFLGENWTKMEKIKRPDYRLGIFLYFGVISLHSTHI